DVGRLQKRIAKETVRVEIVFLDLAHLLLIGRNPLQPWERNNHRKKQMQLGMLHDTRLDEQCRSIGVDSRGKPVDSIVDNVFANARGGIVVGRQRVPVHDAVKALVFVLQPNPVVKSADEVTEVQLTRRPHAAEDSWLWHIHATRYARTTES